jgi:hypothetical protein
MRMKQQFVSAGLCWKGVNRWAMRELKKLVARLRKTMLQTVIPTIRGILDWIAVALATTASTYTSAFGLLGSLYNARVPPSLRLPWPEGALVRVGRVMLIGYSSIALVLTLAVIAIVVFKHPLAPGDPAETASITRSTVITQETNHVDATHAADGISVHR